MYLSARRSFFSVIPCFSVVPSEAGGLFALGQSWVSGNEIPRLMPRNDNGVGRARQACRLSPVYRRPYYLGLPDQQGHGEYHHYYSHHLGFVQISAEVFVEFFSEETEEETAY